MKRNLQRIFKRMDREIGGPLDLFSEQFRYGHREILVAYANLSPDTIIRGSIEHGYSPLGPSLGVPKIFGGRHIHFSWSSLNMARNSYPYPKSVVPIGAPFLYLDELINTQDLSNLNLHNRKYLFFPPHGSEHATPNMTQIIESYKKDFDPHKSSVQLYWTDFLNTEIRDKYERAGFRVTCAGFCGLTQNEGLGISARKNAMSVIGGRPRFLLNVWLNIFGHEEVVEGTIGSSTLYSGFLKKPITLLQIWHSYNSTYTDDSNVHYKDLGVKDHPSEKKSYDFYMSEVVPKYFDGRKSVVDKFYEFCREELGSADMLGRDELAKVISENKTTGGAANAVNELLQDLSPRPTRRNI